MIVNMSESVKRPLLDSSGDARQIGDPIRHCMSSSRLFLAESARAAHINAAIGRSVGATV